MTQASVYLADLRHYYLGVLSTDSMPLGVGNMKAVLDRDVPELHSRIFVYPQALYDAMRAAPPDVLLLSNYIWNEALSLHFARLAKTLNPNALTVMGGPNFPIEEDRKIAYMREHPFVDIYVTGEGDFIAAEIVQQYLDTGCNPDKVKEGEIRSAVYRRGDTYYSTPLVERRKDLDSIPSPWLTGVMDEFFDGRLVPLFETNRGCPFTCTFCVQGGRWWSKVNYFSLERLKEELYYIARKVHAVCPHQKVLRLADLNYGMYERDVQISAWMGEVQKEYDWPLLIDATTGKNQADRIIRSIEKVNGALVMYQAVQSLDEDVLLNVKRKNISLETYEKVQVHVRGRGLRSSSDMILGLPGDSLVTHKRSLQGLIDSGTHQLHNFQAMMLKGSELDTAASRAKYGLQTRFRLLPKNFGRYGGDKVLGFEEIVVGTNCLSFDDYLEARKYHFAISVFWNITRFEALVNWAKSFGFSNWDWMHAVVGEADRQEGMRELLADFMTETRNELHESKAAAEAFYSIEDNFQALENNKFGDNLIYKYSAIASFLVWPAVCACAVAATRNLVGAQAAAVNGGAADRIFEELQTWLLLGHAHGQTRDAILACKDGEFHYDIPDWIEAGCPQSLALYENAAGMHFMFALSAENVKNLLAALQVWDYDLKTFSMLVKRVHNSWQIRSVTRAATPVALDAAPAPA